MPTLPRDVTPDAISSIAGLTPAADKAHYYTGSAAAALEVGGA